MSPPLSRVRAIRWGASCPDELQPCCNPAATCGRMLGSPESSLPEGDEMRARYPDTDGYVERDGVKVFYEVYGNGDPTILLMPTWPIVHSRLWKGQVAYLAR